MLADATRAPTDRAIAVVDSYESLIAVCRTQVRALGINYAILDVAAGFTDGYAAKLLGHSEYCSSGGRRTKRHFSPESFGTGSLHLMGPNRRAQERERAAARAAAEARRVEAEHKAIADAQNIVAIWNARQAGGRELWFYPTVGAAIAAGVPWLTYSCPACQQIGAVDLRTLDRHPGASISSIIPSCRAGGAHQTRRSRNSKC